MKTLHLRRHSIKDGANNTIGPKGLQLAYEQGKAVYLGYVKGATGIIDCKARFTKLFHGPLIRTAQTALAFCQGLGYMPEPMPIVFGLGDEALFAEMITPQFKEAVNSGLSNFAAVRQVHRTEQIIAWANINRVALNGIFNAMKDGEIAVGFFHSPTIELAAWAYGASQNEEIVWSRLGDMEGLIFVDDGEGLPALAGRISAPQSAAA